MLTSEQRSAVYREVREVADEAMRASVVKRFSPGVSYADANGGHNVNYGKAKIFNSQNELVDEPSHSFESLGDFARQIIRAAGDEGYQTKELRDWHTKTQGELTGGEDSQGGYLLPSQFSTTMFEMALEQSIIRPRAQYQPMTHRQLDIPALLSKDNSSNFFGGIQIQRSSEGGTLTATNPKFENIKLSLHKTYGLCHVTNELIEDSPVAIEAHLRRVFPAAIAFIMDSDFLVGSGASQPLGMLNSANPALITVNAVSGQGASTIIAGG